MCKLRERAASCDFGESQDDYIRDQLIDKYYSSNLRRKFLEEDRAVTLDSLLKVGRAQEAVSRQLKEMEANSSSSQVNAVGGKNAAGARNAGGARNVGDERKALGGKDSKKPKICYGCGREGHFAGDKKCPARNQACRKCGKIGHFQFKCSQVHRQNGRGKFERKTGTGGRERGTEENFVEGERFSADESRQSPDFAFTVDQNSDRLSSDKGVVTLTVGGVDLSNVLIYSGATCNLMGQQTWNWLKTKGIQC